MTLTSAEYAFVLELSPALQHARWVQEDEQFVTTRIGAGFIERAAQAAKIEKRSIPQCLAKAEFWSSLGNALDLGAPIHVEEMPERGEYRFSARPAYLAKNAGLNIVSVPHHEDVRACEGFGTINPLKREVE